MRALLLLVVCAGPLAAQQASAYLPLDHWTMPYIEHLIAARVMADPTPLTRPLREADVARALREVDTLTTSAAVTATVRRLLAALGDEDNGPRYRIDGSAGVAAATYPLRDPLEIGRGAPPRAPGADRGFVNGGLALQVRLGTHARALVRQRAQSRPPGRVRPECAGEQPARRRPGDPARGPHRVRASAHRRCPDRPAHPGGQRTSFVWAHAWRTGGRGRRQL